MKKSESLGSGRKSSTSGISSHSSNQSSPGAIAHAVTPTGLPLNGHPSPSKSEPLVNEECTSELHMHCLSVLKQLNDFRNSNILCDATLCVDGRTFYAHRNILASCSPYFKAMFSSKMKEANETKPVILNDIEGHNMEELLKYIYTGEIELRHDNIRPIISAANYLLITSLKDRCVRFLKKMLTPTNCLSIENTAEQYDCEWLRTTATTYIKENFLTITSTDEFKDLPVEKLIELLSSDETRVEREEQIFEALMAWINHDLQNRRRFFADLIQHVRFPLMSPYYLMDHVETEEMVRSTPDCIDLLLEAKNYHMLPDRRWQLKSNRTTPRASMGIVNGVIAVGGIQGTSVVASTSCYLLCANQWFVLAKMNTPRCRHGLSATGEFVYAVGGQYREGAAQSSLASVERYDPKTNTWTNVSQMLCRRSLLNVAALEGMLYAVGGCDESNLRLHTMERYNPTTDTWSFVPPMSTCRSSPCVIGDKLLYVIGGVSYVGIALNTGEKFDPHTNTWSKLPPMNTKRASACGAVVSGKIYVIGGWDGANHLNSGEVFDTESQTWNQIAPANFARWDAGIAVDGDKIFIVGGCDRNAVCTLETECYDTNKDTWTRVASLPVATHGLKCCTVQLPSKFV